MSLKNFSLLVISDRYPHDYDSVSLSFVKSQVDCLKKQIKKIYVISLTPFVPKFLSNFTFMNPRWRRDAFAYDYKYDNVEVHFAKYFTLPFNFSRAKKGHVAFKVVDNIIKYNKINFDLIHAHFTYPSGYVSLKLKEIYEKPIVLTVHENRNWFLNEISLKDEKFVYTWRNVDKIIRVNRMDLKEFDKFDIDKSKLLYIPNGFSSNLFKPDKTNIARKKLGLPLDMKILVNIANLEEYKGQKYLIKSIGNILAVRDDVILYIIGQGSLERSLQSLIDEYGIQNNVILAGGNKPREEIPLWLNACDLFVLPSLSESFGIVQIEAMACGKPVVATYNGGSEEFINNEKLGFLVEPRDVNGLAEAILRALDKEWDANYIIGYAKLFTWDKIAKRIMAVYCDLLKEN